MTRRILKFCLIVAACGLFLSGTARADQWTNEKNWIVDYSKSKLVFSGKLSDNTVFQGAFRTFEAAIDFDPNHLDKAKVSITVDLSSATTNDAQRDSMLPQADWFNAGKNPQAKFVGNEVTEAGKDIDQHTVYNLKGTLYLKGFKKDLTIPFTLTQEGEVWHANGTVKLMRTDFNVGEGQFADEKMVKAVVTVSFDIIAKPAAS